MDGSNGRVVCEARGDVLRIENGRVRAEFGPDAVQGGIRQEFSAFDEAAGSWVPIARAWRPTPDEGLSAPRFRNQGTVSRYGLPAAFAYRTTSLASADEDRVEVILEGSLHGNRIRQTMTLERGIGRFHVEVRAGLADPDAPTLEFLLSSFEFLCGKPDFTQAPCMKRGDDYLMPDRVFFAPAVILQRGARLCAVVPDLDRIDREAVFARNARSVDGTRPCRVPEDPDRVTMPCALDLELFPEDPANPVVSYGLIDYLLEQHVYWRHDYGNMARELSRAEVGYGFDLFLDADAIPSRGYAAISRFQWEHYGRSRFAQPRPQTMPYEAYADLCFPATFAYRGDSRQDIERYLAGLPYDPAVTGPLPTWLDFEHAGRSVGGIRGTPASWYHHIQFMGWWNNARDAVGLHEWGTRTGDPELVRKAKAIVELALTAPQRDGLFPTVFDASERRWIGSYWRPKPPYDPDRIPDFWDFQNGHLQPCGASRTGVHLLRYARLCEPDPRIADYLAPYGRFLVEHMDAAGCVPVWFDDDLQPVGHLRFNAEGGIHVWFLCELYRAVGDPAFKAAAERLAGFLVREILPQQRWYDFETFYSCARKPESTFDADTGQVPRCTLSMIWAIDGLRELHGITGEPAWLEAAQAVADYAAFYQSVWQPHFIRTAYAFGGYSSQNTDAEWLDMRQSQLGEAYVRLGLALLRQDLVERGVAVVHAQLAPISHPRHVENGVLLLMRYPLGITAENIDHEGLSQIPLRSGFDWGEGGALVGAATLFGLLGGAYVDAAAGIRVGFDGVAVDGWERSGNDLSVTLRNLLALLPHPYEPSYGIDLRVVGLDEGTYRLSVNGGPPETWSSAQLAEGVRLRIEGAARSS